MTKKRVIVTVNPNPPYYAWFHQFSTNTYIFYGEDSTFPVNETFAVVEHCISGQVAMINPCHMRFVNDTTILRTEIENLKAENERLKQENEKTQFDYDKGFIAGEEQARKEEQ